MPPYPQIDKYPCLTLRLVNGALYIFPFWVTRDSIVPDRIIRVYGNLDSA